MRITAKIESEFLASLLKRSVALDFAILDYVDPGYFSVDSYKWLVKKLKERQWAPLAFDFVDQLLLEDIKDDEKRNVFRNQIWELFVRDLTFEDDAVAKFKAFIAYSVVKSEVKSSFDGFERSSRVDFMIDQLGKAVKDASDVIRNETFEHSDYAANYDNRVQERKQNRDHPELNPIVRFGIEGLDMQFEIKGPMIIDFFAPFKRYKSIALNHMGFASLVQGFNVLHVVYENTIDLTESRYDALFSQLSYDRVTSLALNQDEKDTMDRLFGWINLWPSRLKILKCVPKKTTIDEVVEFIEKLRVRENFVPDVIIIDYLNIVAPSVWDKEERLRQGTVVWDMKRMADKYNAPVFTASQAKMEAVKAERLDQSHRGKSIDISQSVNLSIALDQTPEEREEGILVFSPMFSRENPIIVPEVVVDTQLDKMQICREAKDLIKLAYSNYNV